MGGITDQQIELDSTSNTPEPEEDAYGNPHDDTPTSNPHS